MTTTEGVTFLNIHILEGTYFFFNHGHDLDCTERFLVNFLSRSRKMLAFYLRLGITFFFYFFSSSALSNFSNIDSRYTNNEYIEFKIQ
jgi:hypothetical protein